MPRHVTSKQGRPSAMQGMIDRFKKDYPNSFLGKAAQDYSSSKLAALITRLKTDFPKSFIGSILTPEQAAWATLDEIEQTMVDLGWIAGEERPISTPADAI